LRLDFTKFYSGVLSGKKNQALKHIGPESCRKAISEVSNDYDYVSHHFCLVKYFSLFAMTSFAWKSNDFCTGFQYRILAILLDNY
jgi:hypothetical protein